MEIIILSGIPGSGKTTIAKKLEDLGFEHFSIDQFYKKVSKTTDLEWGRDFEIAGYKLFDEALDKRIEQGKDMIIETTGASDLWLEIFKKLKSDSEIHIIDTLLKIDLQEAIKRVEARNKTEHPHKVPVEKLEGWIKRINEARSDYQHIIDANQSVQKVYEQILSILDSNSKGH